MHTSIAASFGKSSPATFGPKLPLQDGVPFRKLLAQSNGHSVPEPTTDAIYGALWQNDLFRCLEYGHMNVALDGSTVVLRGHVTSAHTRQWAEQIVSQAPEVQTVENALVADDEIVVDVCRALAENPRTADETILVAVRHGVVVLSGTVGSAAARDAAEKCAASVSQVRGVSNYIDAPGVIVRPEEEQVLQPCIREEVIATDMAVGRVASVIVSSHNRRVTAFVAQGEFPDMTLRGHDRDWDPYDIPKRERSVVIPREAIAEITPSAVWLRLNAVDAARCPDFDPAGFRRPGTVWQPPYPYQPADVWLDGPGTDPRECGSPYGPDEEESNHA
jgi:hypothetical protein